MSQAVGAGADTLGQRARPATLGLVLAKHGVLMPLLFGPPLVWAVIEGAHALALALAGPLGLGLALSAAVWRIALPRDLRGVEAMATIALLFLFAAALSVPAFMVLGLPPAAALFEAMSAMTTTGLSMARDPDSWPFAAHVLRAWMQWCGGLAMATAVLALVLGPGPVAREMGKVGIDDRNRLTSARSQARALLGAYTLITLIFAGAIGLAIGHAGEGLVLALSAVSTGGFAPRSDSLASYDTLGQSLVILASVAGAVSLLAYVQVLNKGPVWLVRSPSVRRVALCCAICATLLGGAIFALGPGVPFGATYLNLLSAMSTAGFSVSAMPAAPALLLLFVGVMVVGGDRGSTAGGLKIWRIAIAARAVRHALTLPRLPDRAVSPLRYRGDTISDGFLVMLVGLTALYTLTAAAIWTLLLSLGYPPLPALFDTISTLSTVGLGTGVIDPDLPPAAQLVLTAGMWLGRLEFIAVLVLILPRTWATRP